jgi:cell division protein FtsB
MMKKDSIFVQFMLIYIVVFSTISLYQTLSKIEKVNDTIKSQNVQIEKLTEQNKAQDVIINKLNTEYNLKGSK